jgi:hypothetical protein
MSLDTRCRMAKRRRRARGALADQSGVMLVEVLIATALALTLLVPTLALIVQSQRISVGAVNHAQAVQLAQVGLRGMVQELDQAYQVEFPTSTANTGCTESAGGVQPCNVADVLVRLSSSGFSGSDFELRYDCSVASTTISGHSACWRYLCSATAATAPGSTCTAASGTLLSQRLVIDYLINGTVADPVFSFCYPGTTAGVCATGAARPTSATVTIKTPAAGTQPTTVGGDQSTVILSGGLYMPNLDLAQ